MFGLCIEPKEICPAYSTQFVFLTIRLVPGNVVMVAHWYVREWIYGLTWKHVYFNISVLFIVDTNSILKLVFPTASYFCLDGHLGGSVVFIIVTVVVVFIYLFIYLFCFLFIKLFIFSVAFTVILIFVGVVVITTVAFVVGVIVALCMCVCVYVCVCVCGWVGGCGCGYCCC